MMRGRAFADRFGIEFDQRAGMALHPRKDGAQRIAYARSGDTLTATISAIDGSKARSWTYKRR